MNYRLLIRLTAPAIAIGLVLFASCLASISYISHLQSNLANILSGNVASLQAAQELEIRVRQLRFHTLLYLMDPDDESTPPARKRLPRIRDDHVKFEAALKKARQSCSTREELDCVRDIETAYKAFKKDQTHLREEKPKSPADFAQLADRHPVLKVVEPCKELLRLNEEKLRQTRDESRRVSEQAHLAMLVLGLAGPIGGLVMGYGVARGLSHSIYRLSVRVRDMAQHLDEKVGSVRVVADGDIHSLDRQMERIIGKIEDVATRLQQQQRELMRAEQLSTMGQLAAGVAHEVRNPLTGIKLLVEAALRSRNPRPLGAEDVRMIHREVARLEQTVQGFLDFARMPKAERAPCDLREVVAQARELVRVRARQQNVEIAVSAPEEPVPALVDRGQFGTVLVNLFINALDAMPGGGRIDVELSRAGASGVRLTVSDTGGGIPAELADRLFRPFTTTKSHGTGLGLSISARILEEHGGTITADNRPEGGARFTICLPPERGTDAPPVATAAGEPSHADAAAD
jgi:two-component system, NtrC family, sensor histidine kinase HydH